jgi:hypothetical protein
LLLLTWENEQYKVLREKETYVPAKIRILVQASKILPTISPIYGVNTSISRRFVGDILSENRNLRTKHADV